MQGYLDQLEELRKDHFELINPTPIEAELKVYYEYIRTKRSERCKEMTSVERANNVMRLVGKNKDSSICLFLTLSMRELDKRKSNNEQHLRKCHDAITYLQKAKELLRVATENEKILYEKIYILLPLLIAVQCPPEEY